VHHNWYNHNPNPLEDPMECEICKQKMAEDEACELHGKKVCEDCFIEANSPTKGCGAGIGGGDKSSK